jgi:tyrosinase
VTASWPYMSGQTGGGCVQDGPFQNYTMGVGPGLSLTSNPHCLRRGLNPDTIPYLKSEKVTAAMASDTYLNFDIAVQGPQDLDPSQGITLFHGSGHFIQGGDSTDFISSSTGKLPMYNSW